MMDEFFALMSECEKLKSVYRKTRLPDHSRHENAAEHSWHLALALMVLDEKFSPGIDLPHALKLALVHDLGEIDAGDLSVFDPQRHTQYADEKRCIERLAGFDSAFARTLPALWEEYEAQESPESRWVRVVDRLLPFMLNLNTQGVAWREMDVDAARVREVIAFVDELSPEIHRWMLQQLDLAVSRQWLRA